MKKLNYLFLLLFACVLSFSALAQDKIYKKGGDVVDAKVTEVGTNEVKYIIYADQNGPIYSLDKGKILKIVYQNGRTESFQSNLKDPELYADQSKNAIKLNFLAPLLGYTQINFEHNMRPGRSYELALGIIGLGKRQELDNYYGTEVKYRNAAGAFLGAGYKFSKIPDFVNNTEKYSHVLQGLYAKPEVILGVYGEDESNSTFFDPQTTEVITRKTVVFGGFLVNGGKQWVLGDAFLIDVYVGLGYAFDNNSRDSNLLPENHFALVGGGDSGLGYTAGIKIGVLLNNKKRTTQD